MASYFKLASIHRHPNSRYWYCCINIPGRGQLQRTTKQTNPRKTYEFAQKLEQAARANVLTEIQARKILAEIYEIKNAGERLPGSSVKDYFESWANNKARETARSTGAHYKGVALRFIQWLGEKSDRDITALAPRDILAFRDHLASRLSASTANHAIKAIRMALKDAQAASLVTANVAAGIRLAKSPEHDGPRHKRPFTIPEIRRLLLIESSENSRKIHAWIKDSWKIGVQTWPCDVHYLPESYDIRKPFQYRRGKLNEQNKQKAPKTQTVPL